MITRYAVSQIIVHYRNSLFQLYKKKKWSIDKGRRDNIRDFDCRSPTQS